MSDSHGNDASSAAVAPHSRKQYLVIFGLLFGLTVLEVLVTLPSLAIPKGPMVVSLVTLALTKAVMVAWFFMHLKQELKPLRWMIAVPFGFPALYAVVLISEAAWRLIR